MFKFASLFIKNVCVNNTYNLNLISGAYIFFIYEIRAGGGGGGVKRVPNGFIYFMCSFGVIPHLKKSAIKNINFWNTLKRLAKCNCLSSRLCHVSNLICFLNLNYLLRNTLSLLLSTNWIWIISYCLSSSYETMVYIVCLVMCFMAHTNQQKCMWIIQEVRFCDKKYCGK